MAGSTWHDLIINLGIVVNSFSQCSCLLPRLIFYFIHNYFSLAILLCLTSKYHSWSKTSIPMLKSSVSELRSARRLLMTALKGKYQCTWLLTHLNKLEQVLRKPRTISSNSLNAQWLGTESG